MTICGYKHYSQLKTYNAKLIGMTKNSVSSIRNKSYWNFNNLNLRSSSFGLFSQKDLIEADEKAQRRIKEKKRERKSLKETMSLVNKFYRHKNLKC